MLSILYLVAATYFGDRICRRYFCFISIPHRIATSFLVGLLLSTWIVCLGAIGFARFSSPLLAGNILFLIVFALVCYKLPSHEPARCGQIVRPPGSPRWDWLFIAAFVVMSSWLMFATLGFKQGQFQIAFKAWTDFGANVSVVQSFALGHNFPPEHPFFPGELIRYHFLFWFQAANLEYLGFNPVWSINLLSICSLVALLILIASFGELLFRSRIVGRLGASFFFVSSSLSYMPFLRSQENLRSAWTAVVKGTEFLASGYPFRGETWGALSANVFAYQRHLISGIGLLFVVMIFVIERYRGLLERESEVEVPEAAIAASPTVQAEAEVSPAIANEIGNGDHGALPMTMKRDLPAFIFSGALIGLLPYWNSPVFVAALAICGCLFLFFPYRKYLAALIGAALLFGLPQVFLLRQGSAPSGSLLHWGYTLEQPTPVLVLKYLAWTFGLKWLLVAVALILLSGFQRRLFLAISSLLAIVFLFQLSPDIFNNHKLLNIWAIFANVYAAFALWRISKQKIVGPGLAIGLGLAMVFGGIIDLFPLHNDPMLVVPYKDDRLTQWLLVNTRPSDVFLTNTVLTHPILFTGRKIYMGYTLFAWTAGYDVPPRERLYRQMFEEADPAKLKHLLNDNQIAYVAIDDGVRHNEALFMLNEDIYEANFEKVFEDTEQRYDNLVIYRVAGP